MAVCKYHPDRPGIGVCVRCRAVICSACCTRVNGINHCHACLKALARKSEAGERGAVPGAVLAVLGLVVSWAFFFSLLLLLRVQGLLAP